MQQKDPFQIFDNVYSVSFQTVNAFLIATSDGLVLIDAGWPETADLLLDSIRNLGFDPAEIRYIFVTHAAMDHHGGVGGIKRAAPNARIGMPLADWEEAERLLNRAQSQNPDLAIFSRDLILTDGQTLTLGDTTFKFYVLPGRTPGSLGIEYPVRDRDRTYRAMSTGALGTYPEAYWAEPFLDSIERLKALGPWDVWLPNHPFMTIPDLLDIERGLEVRGDGPHPAVIDASLVDEQLDFVLMLMRRKMEIEEYQASQ